MQMKKILLALLTGVSFTMTTTSVFAATYQVQSNDTLWGISQKENVAVSSLEAANPNIDPANLQVGEELNIPQSTEYAYTVQPGDTLWSIAQKYNVSVNDLIMNNSYVDSSNLQIGQVLNIPAASSSASTNTATNTVTTTSGQNISYSRALSVVATAYTAAANENGYGAVDYLGNPLKEGTIAVDPSVIPLGSKLYITGPGVPNGGMIGNATDEGSSIKGDRIDIFMSGIQAADNFGMQNVKVYILK